MNCETYHSVYFTLH